MRREECVDLFKRIPEEMHPQVNFVLRNQFVVTVESIARFEPAFVVFRGREGGTSDDGRAFFIPYEEICYIRIEREVRMGELKKMYGETGYIDSEDRLETVKKPSASDTPAPKSALELPTPQPTPTPVPVTSSDPASIAKQNLLDRIRAARANAGTSAKAGGAK
jgi:hypothetical protein